MRTKTIIPPAYVSALVELSTYCATSYQDAPKDMRPTVAPSVKMVALDALDDRFTVSDILALLDARYEQ
jgi:hypothetical protein